LYPIIVVELSPSEMFLEVKKQMDIAGREVRALQRMVQYIQLKIFQKRGGDVRGARCAVRVRAMGPRVVVEQAHAA